MQIPESRWKRLAWCRLLWQVLSLFSKNTNTSCRVTLPQALPKVQVQNGTKHRTGCDTLQCFRGIAGLPVSPIPSDNTNQPETRWPPSQDQCSSQNCPETGRETEFQGLTSTPAQGITSPEVLVTPGTSGYTTRAPQMELSNSKST